MKLVLSDVGQYRHLLPEIENSYLECLRIGEHPEQGGVVGAGSFKAAYNLGLWYEVSGNGEKAAEYYRQSALAGFEPAARQLALALERHIKDPLIPLHSLQTFRFKAGWYVTT